ncbi:hypothetical protein PSTG_00541 [Puccinia striiformis f. sp. tritici PST-78]|uniref:Uncharacterized protein n=1 Tax=Puccinia striiformis f. sp. tritici PST-78 TaxID=1165861 RepID=A0A0L0W5B6_9BASI|nr:hypothetical protein PSTG_00541 [Puccinia striiformis f. sp. tritici PST-78]
MNLDIYIIEHTSALKVHPDYTSRVKLAKNFIQLHLSRKESTRFIDDLDTYDPKTLWESILSHYATDMQTSINAFQSLFKEMIEVSSGRFDKKTLEAMWIFFVLKGLPGSFYVYYISLVPPCI